MAFGSLKGPFKQKNLKYDWINKMVEIHNSRRQSMERSKGVSGDTTDFFQDSGAEFMVDKGDQKQPNFDPETDLDESDISEKSSLFAVNDIRSLGDFVYRLKNPIRYKRKVDIGTPQPKSKPKMLAEKHIEIDPPPFLDKLSDIDEINEKSEDGKNEEDSVFNNGKWEGQ